MRAHSVRMLDTQGIWQYNRRRSTSPPTCKCWRIMTHHVLLYLMMSCICPPRIYGAMFGWDVPLWVDPLLLAMFLFLHNALWHKDRHRPWPNSSEKARRSRKREPQRSLRGLQMQNRAIRDPDVQRDPIGTPADPPHPMKTSSTNRASDNRAY